MTRREMREHTFKELFLNGFHSENEYAEQYQLYLERQGEMQESDEPAFLRELNEEEKQQLAEKAARITEKLPELDEKINEVSTGWKTSRMAKVDLTILRLALYEILYDDEVTKKAVALAQDLRKKAKNVEMIKKAKDRLLEEYVEYGREYYAGNLIYLKKTEEITMVNLVTGEHKIVNGQNGV